MKLSDLTPEAYASLTSTALALLAEGKKQTEVREALQLNHSQLDLIVYQNQLTEEDFSRFLEGGGTLGERVAVARNVLHLSWGVIGLLAGEPESRVRREYAKQTEKDSKGQRIGKGGRWLMNEPTLYERELNPTGTILPAGQVYNRAFAIGEARVQRIYKLDFDETQALAREYGLTWDSKKYRTKARFTEALIKAITGEGDDPEAVVKAKRVRKPRAPKPEVTVEVTAEPGDAEAHAAAAAAFEVE